MEYVIPVKELEAVLGADFEIDYTRYVGIHLAPGEVLEIPVLGVKLTGRER